MNEAARVVRISSLVVDYLTELLGQVLSFEGPADAVMSRFFKLHHKLGQRDRGFIAEAVFHALRNFGSLHGMLAPADPGRAPRLAALVTLARQYGVEAISERAMGRDAPALRSALRFDRRKLSDAAQAELPQWLYDLVIEQYPDAGALCEAMTQPAPLDLRVNLMKAKREAVMEALHGYRLGADGAQPEVTPFSPEGIRLHEKPALMRWPLYQDGLIEVQDEGSQLIARLLAPKRGQMVADFCAGAGGKTLALGALMRSTGRLYAFDINAKRLAGLGPRLKRSGLSNVHPTALSSERDVRIKRLAGKMDRVLVDAPCSGSGTLRRNPDLKMRFDEQELARVCTVQAQVLRAAARLVKPGGRLVYATCSLLARENQDQIEAFLKEHPQFSVRPAAEVLLAQGIEIEGASRFSPWFVMLPHVHGTDGFFAAVLEKAVSRKRE